MTEAVVVAVITGLFAVIGNLIVANRSNHTLYDKIDKQSELSDAKIQAQVDRLQAVTDAKIDELTREVREHNNFARRVPVLEEQIKVANHRIADLEQRN